MNLTGSLITRSSYLLTNYEILVSQTASKELNALEENVKERIKSKLRDLGKDPFNKSKRLDVKKLSGAKRTYYRLRVGEYRIIYFLVKNTVKVARIATRSDAYSWLD